MREAVFQAAADYLLGSDVQASEVAKLTPFSDATVRAETRKLGVPERRRGPQRKQEPTVGTETSSRKPVPSPEFMSAADRTSELIAMREKLPAGRLVELVSHLEKHHWQWLRANRRTADSDAAIVDKAIRAGLLSMSDLR